MDQETLMEVKDDGQTLVLTEGKKLNVDPKDRSAAMLWLPSTLLGISDIDVARFSSSV